MSSDEIRERFLSFFEEHGHRRIASASLVPPSNDTSALLTVAGMHPLKPFFLGREVPPAPRLTSCQKVFRTVDIDNVGNTSRHLTFFEMLGNFSFGDYFKEGAIEYAWKLSLDVFDFDAKDIWVTVFEGDEDLGLGPDEEAIARWLETGVPRDRIVLCPRSENFWEAGPTGPCGPCSELYIDRGVEFGLPEDLPGGDNERFLEYWNLVFMQYDQRAGGAGTNGASSVLTPLPAKNIDTGLGLNRLAAVLQQKGTVFETDQFAPLIELGETLSGRSYGADDATDRSLRILADHSRAMTFLTADGVVPSNEDRGYVLRRVMRRAIQQGRNLGLEPGFLTSYAQLVRELMGGAYAELSEHAAVTDMWLATEEESFGRTLAQGLATLREHVERARDAGLVTIGAEEVFRLHDTFGFPREMTEELLGEEGLAIEGDFDALMARQRERGRLAVGAGAAGSEAVLPDALVGELLAESEPTRFTGYETTDQHTTVAAAQELGDSAGGRLLVKLAESPFYAPGGGQVADVGTIECDDGDCRATVTGVIRRGDDQLLEVALEAGTLERGEHVHAQVDQRTRHATEANHTATHLLQAALRERLGGHIRQAGSYVGPDKLRFDFSHGQGLTSQECADVEDQVNEWISRNERVRAITTTLDEAKALGAMALFGEKYGDVVRMVEVGPGQHSRELCGGTHVGSTAEIGPFRILSETSSSANVRRIEAVTGPVAVALLRSHDGLLSEIAGELRTRPEQAAEAVRRLSEERRRLEKELAHPAPGAAGESGVEELAGEARELHGATVLARAVQVRDAKALLELADRVKGKIGDAAILLGTAVDGRVHLLASVAPELVARGVKAGAIVKTAAEVVGGGGGGRDTMAQAGGRDPAKLDDAIAAGAAAIEAALAA